MIGEIDHFQSHSDVTQEEIADYQVILRNFGEGLTKNRKQFSID